MALSDDSLLDVLQMLVEQARARADEYQVLASSLSALLHAVADEFPQVAERYQHYEKASKTSALAANAADLNAIFDRLLQILKDARAASRPH